MAALHPLRVSPAGDVPIDRTLTPTLRLVRTHNPIPTLNPTLTLTLTPNPDPDPDRSSAPHQVPMLSDRHISLRIWMLSQSSTFSRRLDGPAHPKPKPNSPNPNPIPHPSPHPYPHPIPKPNPAPSPGPSPSQARRSPTCSTTYGATTARCVRMRGSRPTRRATAQTSARWESRCLAAQRLLGPR